MGVARRVVVLGLAVAAVVAPAAGAAPPDYTRAEGLSQPGLETERRVIELPSFDGTELHVEIVEPVAAGPHPVILQASPYHETDRNGIELMQPALTEWF